MKRKGADVPGIVIRMENGAEYKLENKYSFKQSKVQGMIKSEISWEKMQLCGQTATGTRGYMKLLKEANTLGGGGGRELGKLMVR